MLGLPPPPLGRVLDMHKTANVLTSALQFFDIGYYGISLPDVGLLIRRLHV